MGATHLLGHLRRLRSSPVVALFYTFHNTRTFPLLHGGGHLLSAPPGDHGPLLEGRRPLSSWVESASPGFEEGSAAGGGEGVSVGGGVDLSVPVIDGGEDSIWYAPVRAVISLLDGYHEATGLPWWITIATSTLALRVSLLPVLLVQLKKAQKMAQLFPKLPPPLPPPFSGKSFKEQFLLFRKKRLELGCPSYLWNFAFVSVQIDGGKYMPSCELSPCQDWISKAHADLFPCFLTWMTSIRRMSLDNHPGFDCGGVLWFQNLTEFSQGAMGSIFPLLVAGLHFANVQISFQNVKLKEMPGIFGLLARYYKLYLDILSFPLLLIGFNIPQGSLVYWVTNSSLTLVQQLSLQNPYIRKNLGLPENASTLDLKKPKENPSFEQNLPASNQSSTDHLPPEELLQLALNHMSMQCQDKALPLLRVAIEKDPGLVKALIALGQISCSRGLLAEAAKYFECALSKTKDQEVGDLVLASFGAGFSHLNQGKKEEGIEHLKRIAQLKEPESPADRACYYSGLVLLGSTLFNEGQKSEAARYLRMAAVYDPAVNVYIKQCEEE